MKILMTYVVTTVVYFITFLLTAFVFTFITNQPIDLARDSSGTIIGICLVILPYIFNGFICRKVFINPFKGALITSLVLVISERVLIYLIGLLFVLRGGDSLIDDRTVMNFIQGEAAPYYTLLYIIMGLLSVCISVFVALIKRPYSMKADNLH